MSATRIGIVGAGHLGRIHAKLIQNVKRAKLTAIAEPQPLVQQQMLDQYDCQVISDYRKMIDLVDAVIIATPTVTHYDVAKFFLEQGVHVLIEKPFTHCAEQARDLVDLADRTGAKVQIGHVERYNPAVKKALEFVGQAKFIDASRCSGYTFRSTDIGVVHDLMIHDIELVNWIFGSSLIESRSVGISVFGQNEDIARSWMHFECGGIANLTASRCSFSPERTMKIFGTEGFASIDLATSELHAIKIPGWLRKREFDFQNCTAAQAEFVKNNLFEQVLPVEVVSVDPVNAIQMEQADWVEAILDDRTPTVCAETGFRAVAVAQRVLDQIAMHSWAQSDRSMTGPHAIPPNHSRQSDAVPQALLDAGIQRKAG